MNINNKLSGLFIVFIILSTMSSSLVSATASYNTDSPYLKLLLEEVTPEPVEPGQYVTVKIRIINEGGEAAEDVSVKLNYDSPFFLKTTSDDPEKTKDLCIGCSMDNTYYLIVDADAKSGLYPLTFEISYEDVIVKPSETIDIKIVGKPDILLQTTNTDTNVTSGEKFNLEIQVDNIGTGIARNIKIIPNSENIMMLGSNVNLVTEILPDQTKTLTSEFIIKESLEPDTYKFPITLEYVDEQGNSYTESFDIGINVLNKADIGIQSIKINPTNPTLLDQVHLEGILENTGKGEANKVTIELITENKKYQAFVGQLKADDDAPFYFDAKPETVGINTAKLKISYYDDFGYHEIETTLEKEVQRPKNNLITIIIILAIAGAGIWYFLHKRKKAKK
jgi:hypothetical protein